MDGGPAVTDVINLVPRQRPVKAMRVILGITTKADITAFCPRANVGVRVYFHNGEMVEKEKQITWVAVPHNGDLWDKMGNDGDWIVEKAPGHFFIYSDAALHAEFVIA